MAVKQQNPVGWLLAGAAVVLAAVVLLVTAFSIERNEEGMARLLAEKGSALIRAVEGGLRTGMRNQMGVRLQELLEEVANNNDILFIAVTMPDGTIVAHSKPRRLGEVLTIDGQETTEMQMRALLVGPVPQWRTMNMEGQRAFVVYRHLLPVKPEKLLHRGVEPPMVPAIFLGLELSPFENTRAQDRSHMRMLAGFVILVGILCLVALYFAQRARDSHRRQRAAEGQVRLLEEEVRRKEKLAAVGTLAAGVAHEIRNPLSSIKGYATYFGQLFPEGSEDRAAAGVMVREVDRLNRVITDLIGFSRPTDVHLQPTPLTDVAEHALRLLGQDAAQRGVKLVLDAAPSLPPALLDADRFGQALLNVCLNALEAMPQGGVLTLRLTRYAAKRLCLEVHDTGTGIAPEHLPHIFDPYFTSKKQGTGLGLATVHKIVEAHGGEVVVNTQYASPHADNGTSFRFLLPIATLSENI
ncbi:MAG: two-component system sensor histidine kinase ZraS [Desulfovibrionaceae bacterium]